MGETRYRVSNPFEKRDRQAQEPPRFACPGCGDEVIPSASCARCDLMPTDATGRTARHVVDSVRSREAQGADLRAGARGDGESIVARATIASISDTVGGAAASVEPVFEDTPSWKRWLGIRGARIEACGTFLVRHEIGLVQVSAATAVFCAEESASVGVGDELTLIGRIETSDDPYRGTVRRFIGAIALD